MHDCAGGNRQSRAATAPIAYNGNMSEPWAYLDGAWVPASAAAVSVFDAGFVLGATVAEQLRTFGGRLFHRDDHLDRLAHSLEIIGVELDMPRAELAATAEELVARNHRLLAAGDDLGLSIFVTPGPYTSYLPAGAARPPRPTLGLHTYPLPFHLWAEKYAAGEAVVATDVRQVPDCCWPATLKCRSRMHYYLADRQAAATQPGARALLLDASGCITEASTANLLIFRRDEGLVSPPLSKILHGISLAVAMQLAGELGIATAERDLTPEDVAAADETMLTSTPLCLLPVTRFNGRAIGTGRPGPISGKLLEAWGRLVGLDIAGQARAFARR
jgi:branched-subunit amino acid aminotransferase/4-amino-4-deoxychorismate lyase